MNKAELHPQTESDTDKIKGAEEAADILFIDYIKFIIFCFLLLIPAYAVIKSVIDNNWLMVVIDLLLVPVGFVHGILLIFGVVN